MSQSQETDKKADLLSAVKDILEQITQEREQQIISRRFGLYDRKETLEQIGEMLGITRERVRQLEKAILIRLRLMVADGKIPSVTAMEKTLTSNLAEMGRVARIQDLAGHHLEADASQTERAHVAFIAELVPSITLINENDDFYQAAAIGTVGDEKQVKKQVEDIVKAIKQHGKPVTAEELHGSFKYEHPSNITALASISKK